MKRGLIGAGLIGVLALVGCQRESTLYDQQGPAAPPQTDIHDIEHPPVDIDRQAGGFGGGAGLGGEYEPDEGPRGGTIIQREEDEPVVVPDPDLSE